MAIGEPDLTYDPVDNIVFMSFPTPAALSTRPEIAAHFERVVRFWRSKAGSKKAYFVVDFDNVTISIAEIDFYAQQSKRAHEECALASVRYGGSPLQRAATRLAGMKVHLPSNIYESRAEALAVVRALRAGGGPARALPSARR